MRTVAITSFVPRKVARALPSHAHGSFIAFYGFTMKGHVLRFYSTYKPTILLFSRRAS
jgi:hypothetical protein